MLKSKHLLTSFIVMLVGLTLFAQETKFEEYPYPYSKDKEYSDYIKPKFQEQHDKFLDRKYNFPPPPKSQWEIGLDIGALHVSGDVKTKSILPGFGIGGHVRKSFGYVFSVRGSLMLGTTYGEDWQGKTRPIQQDGETDYNNAIAGWSQYDQFNTTFERTPDYSFDNGGSGTVFLNYKSRIRQLVLSGIVNFNNIKFHKRRNKFTYYGVFGIGGLVYNTTIDQLDADGNEYFDLYSGIRDFNQEEDKGDVKTALEARDGSYESQAEMHFDDYWIFGSSREGDHNWSYRPTAHIGLGTAIKVTKRINIGLESTVTYTNDDLLDGDRWTEWGSLSRDYDTYVFTNLSLNVNLGRKNTVEPLWWMNPLDYAYSEMNEKPCCDDLEIPDLTDSDGDGVPDIFDEEPDSRPDCPVDTKGRMLDSDRDGVLDCDDDQPHTPSHLIGEVDERGVAMEENCCDEIEDIKRRLSALEYEAPCDDSMLPNVLFKDGSTAVSDNFRPQLQAVADYLRSNPDIKLCVVGHTDTRGSAAANDLVSWKRANDVINKLTSEFGISRSQLILQYRGENEPIIRGMSEFAPKKGVDAEFALSRRVDFRCCEGSYDMPKPGR